MAEDEMREMRWGASATVVNPGQPAMKHRAIFTALAGMGLDK
jgi:hypothetical protein